MISHWVGWITLVVVIGELLCFAARRLKNNKFLQKLRGKHHMSWGKFVLALGLVHGLLTCTFSISGIVFLCLILGLYGTYLFRKQLGKLWMVFHRLLAVGTIIAGLLHIFSHRI